MEFVRSGESMKRVLVEKQCMTGKCDYCKKSLFDEHGETKTDYVVLMKNGDIYNNVLGEWCSETFFTNDKNR